MKDINDCENFAEIEVEFRKGQKRLREILAVVYERQQNGNNRMSYSGLRELIEAMELNEFILENTEGSREVGA